MFDLPVIVRVLAAVVLLPPTLVALLSKCFFLAPYRAGWLMWAANLVYELLYKKYYWQRRPIDLVLVLGTIVGWTLLVSPWAGLAAAALLAAAWTYALETDLRWRTGGLAVQHKEFGGTGSGGKLAFIPMPLPRLIMVIRGPAIDRSRQIDLGDWPQGNQDAFEVLVLNPSDIVPQLPMTLSVTSDAAHVAVSDAPAGPMPAPEPGALARLGFTLRAAQPGPAATVRVELSHGSYRVVQTLHLRSVVPAAQAQVVGAEVRKWKGGASAGFGWRGDHDLYDPCTFQDARGLRLALTLSKRFHLPTTIYISGRLSFDQKEHEEFCRHFGFDRRTGEIPGFIKFLREECHFESELDFPLPLADGKPFAAELGNHMYLHYGTHAVVCEGNKWQLRSEMGAGRYEWQGPATDSFSEQRDNAARNVRAVQDAVGVTIRSWGVPGRANDKDTGRALEAAGMVVASDCDASAWDNVMRLPPPHHPKGCERLVELTKKYPGDATNAFKVAMIKYWMHYARRTGRVFLYMAHHHMMLYEGWACYRLTEESFRYALAENGGDFYVATICALGLYWDRVLCPKHRVIRISHDNASVTVQNTGDVLLDRLPVEIDLGGGRRFMKLLDVPAGGESRATVAS